MHTWEELGLDFSEYVERIIAAYEELRQVIAEDRVEPYLTWLDKDRKIRAVALLKWILALLDICETLGVPPEVVSLTLLKYVNEAIL